MAAMESGADTASIAGTVGVAGALDATEGGTDTASFNGLIVIEGGLSASEAGRIAPALPEPWISREHWPQTTMAATRRRYSGARVGIHACQPKDILGHTISQFRVTCVQGRSSQSVMQDKVEQERIMSTHNWATKDPDEVLDYAHDWSAQVKLTRSAARPRQQSMTERPRY